MLTSSYTNIFIQNRVSVLTSSSPISLYNFNTFTIVSFLPPPSPVSPEKMDWSPLYPDFFPSSPSEGGGAGAQVEFADVGCGYGGLLGNASP